MQPKKNNDVVAACNQILLDATAARMEYNWYEYSDRNNSPRDIVYDICRHGLLSKFERPESAARDQRRKDAAESYIRNDRTLTSIDPYGYNPDVSLQAFPLEVHERLCRARDIATAILTGSQYDPSDLWVGPGETFVSLGGYTSALNKLEHPWTVTTEARSDFLRWVKRNRHLWRILISDWKAQRTERPKSLNEHVDLLLAFLDERVPIVGGSRFTTVPKNNDKDRSIGVEPFGNVMLQKMAGARIRRSLRRAGIDLNSGQQKHAELIRNHNLATIDLSDASDLISLDLMKTLIPSSIGRDLLRWRSPRIFITEHDISFWMSLKKVGSMGNGFTFELETLIFLSLVRTFDPEASVYGDDIICQRNVAFQVMEFLSLCGLRVNVAKSFCDGLVRESCGAFFVGDVSVTRFDFRWAESLFDCVVLANKAYLIAKFLQKEQIEDGLFHRLSNSLSSLLRSRGVPCGPPIKGEWIEYDEKLSHDGYRVDHRFSTLGVFLYSQDERKWSPTAVPDLVKQTARISSDIQKGGLICIVAQRWQPETKVLRSFPKSRRACLTVALRSCYPPTLYKRGKGRFITCNYVVDRDGFIVCDLPATNDRKTNASRHRASKANRR